MPHEPTQWDKNVEKLNSKPEFQLFEVGPSGILVGGDIMLSKGEDDVFDSKIKGVRPGIWHVALEYEKVEGQPIDNFKQALARWVAPGPLNVEALTTEFPEPNLAPLSAWKRVSRYSVDSGSHGVLDHDGLAAAIAQSEGEDKEFILEKCADYGLLDGKVSVQIGFIIVGDDGGYRIMARNHEDLKVEIAVQPNYAEDEEEEGEPDEEEEDGDEE